MKRIVLIIMLAMIMSLCWILPVFAADPVLIENITPNPESAIVSVGKTVNIKVIIDPKKATNKKLEWTSSNEEIATVKNGTVKAVAPGNAEITASSTDGTNISCKIDITVVQPIAKITASESKLVLAPKTTWKPEITIEPKNATVQKLAWSSSNDKIAHVDENGEISAIAVGKCNIIGAATDGSKKKVTIALQVKEHDILILVPGEVSVDFDTRNSSYGSYFQVGRLVISDTEDTTVTFKNGLVCEGSGNRKLRPLKPGSETIESVTKHNGKKVTARHSHTVFISQSAVPLENDDEIGRLEAESYEGHTYQVFYSSRSWDDAEAFCEKHNGHLVTITGEKEQKFIERYLAKAEKQESYWIGLNSGKSSSFSRWVTKEAISFTKWMDNNPDRGQPNSCVRIAASEYSDSNRWKMNRGTWDDESSTYYYINGFICEWDEENSPNVLSPLEPKMAESSSQEAKQETSTVQDEPTFTISSDKESPYVQTLILNAKKDTENTIHGYFIPAGKYKVTNLLSDKALKISPYENTRQTIDGNEEYKQSKDHEPILVFPDSTKELTVGENEFILFLYDEFSAYFEKVSNL